MKPTIKEITGTKALKQFIRFPEELYKDSEYFIPPLRRNEFKTLSEKHNPAFDYCEAKYWLAYHGSRIVGRVAGIINRKYNDFHKGTFARFGWLDFIEDKDVVQALLQTVEQWAGEKELTTIHGPLGFTSFDASGVLIQGFEELPTSFAHYNYPYYDELIRQAGYEKDVDWVEFQIKVPPAIPEKVKRAATLIRERYQVHEAVLSRKKDILNYTDSFFELINKAYRGLYGFSELTPRQMDLLTKEFFPLVTPEYSAFIVDKEDNLVGIGVTIPSLSKALKKAKGKLFPLGVFRILKALKKNDIIDFLLIAIDPEYQNKGLNALIFEHIADGLVRNGIQYLETNRELEDNVKVQALWKDYNPRQHKKARSYIKKLS